MKQRGHVYQEKKHWRGDVEHHGKRYRFSAKTRDEVQQKIDALLVEDSEQSDDRTADTWTLTRKTRESIRTLPDLIRVCEIDTAEWEVERWMCNKWDMLQADVGPTPLYQVKAWLRRKVSVITVRAELEDIKAEAIKTQNKASILKMPKLRKPDTGFAWEVSLSDHHFGKLAWPTETGWEPYDTELAASLYTEATAGLVARTSGYKFDSIVLVVGNDILHIDNRSLRTESGTQLDSDSRYHKIFQVARRAVQEQVETLRQIAPVRIVIVPGNHDYHAAWHLGDSLEVAFAGHKDVTVDSSPRPRKYWEWGYSGVMWTHGHKSKRRGADLPQIFAMEEPALFGRTKFREVHLGHFHHERSDEIHGVVVRILPSLASTDTWHSENEYVGALRRSQSFIWSKEDGLVGTALWTKRREHA